jgi:prepilin-type N-terminal cleavage/methylation domain-containing protein
MKEQLPTADCRLPIERQSTATFSASIENRKSKIENRAAFTLIELLVVISIISVIAGMTFSVLKGVKRVQYLKTATAELAQIAGALDNYKAKYGVYPPGNASNPLLNQLYYELSGTTINGADYVTLDGSSQILVGAVKTAYGVGGFINCTKGGGEDSTPARNFLSGISSKRVFYPVTNNGVATTILITSVGGPDQNYQPLNASDLNPFRYSYPGTNNPTSYDLWIDLSISGKTNRISNWHIAPIVL